MSHEPTEAPAFLLGAGASVQAGLPLTGPFTKSIAAMLNADDSYANSGLAETFNFICSSMVGHRGKQGVPVEAPLNIERVVSSVRLLSERADHEAAPFVQTWSDAVSTFDVRSAGANGTSGSAVKSAMNSNSSFKYDNLAKVIRSIAAEEAHAAGDGTVFRRLEAQILKHAVTILARHGEVDYLSDIVALGHDQAVEVATLNYDLTVEDLCRIRGVRVSTGIEAWSETGVVDFGDAAVRLHKFHGSIDWQFTRRGSISDGDRTVSRTRINFVDPFHADDQRDLSYGTWAHRDRPAIILGDREKLSADGPSLQLMENFSRRLARKKRLVVVGYSFGDAHINVLIENWLAGGADRMLTVLDPFWPDKRPSWQDQRIRADFRSELWRALVAPRSSLAADDSSPEPAPRMNVIRLPVGLGLGPAIKSNPPDDATGDCSGALEWVDENTCTLTIRCVAPDTGLSGVRVWVSNHSPLGGHVGPWSINILNNDGQIDDGWQARVGTRVIELSAVRSPVATSYARESNGVSVHVEAMTSTGEVLFKAVWLADESGDRTLRPVRRSLRSER